MTTSLFLAKLLGLYFLIIAAGVLLNFKTYRKVMEDLLKNSAFCYLAGVFALFFGLLIILFHNVWTADWRVIVTLMGWLGLVKGVWLTVFPNSVAKVITAHLKNQSLLVVRLVIIFFLGLILTAYGYFVG